MRTMLRGKVTLLFMVCAVLLAIPAVALADIVQNNVVAIEGSKTKYVKPGVSTSVSYFIETQGVGGDGQAGCNAADGSAATVTLTVPAAVTSSDADNKLTFTSCNSGGGAQSVTFSSNTEGTYNITSSVSDSGTGSYTNNANWTLVVDGTAPEVDSTDPANGATGVAVDKDFIKATFDEKVDPATISGSTFSLTGPSGAVAATVSYDAATQTAKLDPTSDLAQNTEYTATLEGGATGTVVKDYAGNALASDYSWSFRTFNPNSEPVLTVPANITEEATSAAGAVVTYTASATDAEDDPDPTPECSPASGSTFPIGTTTVNCSVTDSGGLSDSGSFSVTVQDTTAPDLTLPADITEEATGPSGAAVNFTASADDAVDGSVNVECTPASGSTFELGTTQVDCSATDAAGNTANGSFTVTVEDTTPPALTLPANITKQAPSNSQATVTYSASATDLVDGNVAVQCLPASGSIFPAGTTTVSCSATDAAGNTGKGSFTVTVNYGFDGFYRPVDNLPMLNSVKAGSAVPVKFSLAGNQGLSIFGTGIDNTGKTFTYPTSKVAACDAAAGTDAIEETVTAGQSTLQYDASLDQYTYVWKTEKAWASQCRQLQIKFADGTTKAANFKLLK